MNGVNLFDSWSWFKGCVSLKRKLTKINIKFVNQINCHMFWELKSPGSGIFSK